MNKSSSTQKRSMGKPQAKRPKLDFSEKPSLSHSSPGKSKDSVNSCVNVKSNLYNTCLENQITQNVASTSDWDDDDFSSDMLEKVCLIADLSQAMVNNEPRVKEPVDSGIYKLGYKRTVSEKDVLETGSKFFEQLEKLKGENEKLVENIKTKEGEVRILRSQLKQTQEAKQAETVNNIKLMEALQKSYKEKLEIAEKECDAVRTELQFKELELKNVTERYKLLESSTSTIEMAQSQGAQLDCKKSLFNESQAPPTEKTKSIEMEEIVCINQEEPVTFKLPIQELHEGQKFGNLVCPEIFNSTEESSVITLYKFNRGCGFHVSSLDFDKREKYKWNGLPKQHIFLKQTYNCISKLFLYENFLEKDARDIIENILSVGVQILNFDRDLLLFLENLQEKNSQFDDSDYSLLENEDEVNVITLKSLLNGKKLSKEECGIESRRILAVIVSLILASRSVLFVIIEKPGFAQLLKDLAVSIGNLRKPTRYTGILAGIILLLTQFLRESELEKEFMIVLNEITEEVIFARPKLDVLSLIVDALAVSRNHMNFVQGICRKGSVESCALYMDSKLHQAMFFTKDACPLKLLCTQIMGLACIPVNREMKWNVTRCIIKWLNRMMDIPSTYEIKWLPEPARPENEDKCFDVMECFVYLLNSCLKDYMLFCDSPDKLRSKATDKTLQMQNGELNLLSVIGDGTLLFRRFLKSDQRLLHESCHNLRFATLLKRLNNQNGLCSHQKEAISWIVDLLESDVKNQEGCAKQSASNCCDRGITDALKINDDLIIF